MNPSTQLNDILYPECHLDSPLVAGKLIQLLKYADLPCNQTIEDETLLRNIQINKAKGKRTPIVASQQYLKNYMISKGIDVKKLNHIPYPYSNRFLFRLYDRELTHKLYQLMRTSHSSYAKISERILNLKDHVEKKLGINVRKDMIKQEEKHNRLSIKNLHLIFEGSEWFKPFLFWFSLKTDARDLIKRAPRGMIVEKNEVLYYNLSRLIIFINRNMIVIIEKENSNTHYLTFEMLLMFCDVTEGRLMIDVGMTSDHRYNNLRGRGYALWNFIDSLFEDLGNQTYNIVALIEPLTLGYLQLHDKSPILKGAFLKYVLDEMIKEFMDNGFTNQNDLKLILESVTRIFKLSDIHMTAEFFSFFRTFGHPILEAENAANKVREHMNKPKLVSFKTMMKGHAIFCGIIINGFRERHGGSWPPVEFPNHASKKIINIYHNSESLTDEDCILNWKSFVGFKFKCFLPLVLDDNLTMFMKDKALAAINSEWDSVYPREGMIYSPPPQTCSRRLVEYFLDDSEFDPYNLINYVISGEYLQDPEFNLSYSLKEKEIKQVGRLFAKMTYKMRACQVVAESLIANGVGKFFKENGMAKDEHDLLKTLHKLSVSSVPRDNKIEKKALGKSYKNTNHQPGNKGKGNRIHKQIDPNHKVSDLNQKADEDKNKVQYEIISTFLTTDLQKFCLNWRQETSNIFAERLNEIYGLPGFFNWMHKRLEKSVLYVADPHCPPYIRNHIPLDEVENKQIFIKYPMGGIEGYCQKMWTIITIPFLFLSAYEVGAKIAAVVQGDNEAIAITRRVHPNLPYLTKKIRSTELGQQYFNQLRKNLADIGHNLKANETIISTHFFIYSKRIYYDGLVLSQSLKPLSRTVFWSETIVDETRSACSNISTAIAKSIEQGFSRWIGYAINILKTLQQLMISLKFTINPSMTNDITDPLINNQSWLIAAALLPSQLGGFNYMNMCRLYVRNIGDPAVASIADVKRMINVKLLHESIIYKIMFQEAGDSDYLDWASDPYSLNIPNSQSVTVMLKNITARTVLQNSENPMLKGLFHFDFEQEDRDLAQFLLDRPVIIPRVAHEIMDNSLTGARQEIAGMLDTTKGLIKNSIRLGGIRPRLIDKLSMYDYNQFRIFNNLMRVTKTSDLIDHNACSVYLTINLRKRMWVHLTHGRQIYGLEVPDIIEACNGYIISGCSDCYYCSANQNEFGWFFVPKLCELDSVSHESNNMRVPYFGSTTDERSDIRLSHVRSPSKALRAAIRIAMVYTWAFGDSETSWEEAWYLSSFRANVTIEELKAITPISTSSNIAHRLRDKTTQMKYSGNALNRVGRYTVISNDQLNFVIEGVKVDTNLVYQQVMLIGLSILEDIFRFRSTTGLNNTLLHLHIDTNCCIVEMNDHPLIESESILPVLQKVECNKLIYDDEPIIDKDQIRIHQQLYRSTVLDFPSWDYMQLQTALAQSLSLTIIEIITRENKDHLNEFKVLSNDDDINSLVTEFLLVDPELLTLHLGQCIALNWSYDIYYRRPQGKYQMLEFLDTIMITASKRNFNVLSNVFSHPGIFEKFWDYGLVDPSYGPNLNQQDYNQMSLDYISTCYQTYINYWLNDHNCEYMITESEEEIVDQRFELAQARHLCFIACLYLSRTEMPVIRGMTSIEKCNILTEKIDSVKFRDNRYLEWNTEMLPVAVYPSSLTYIRRGSIKHIRLRNMLSADMIGYDRLSAFNSQPVLFSIPKNLDLVNNHNSTFFPIMSLYSDDFREFNFHVDFGNNPNRWESHVRRRIGINSTSCYKAVEIAKYLSTLKEDFKNRLFLGEGSGSMMTAYYFLLGKCTNFYNTGVSEIGAIGQRVLSVSPSEYYIVAKNNPNTTEMISDLKILFNGKPESTWIGDNDSFEYIMNSCSKESMDLIHSDIESSTSKDDYTVFLEQVHVLCLALNLGCEDSVVVAKIAPQFSDMTNSLIYAYNEFYSTVNAFIPSTSNPYSSEFYIVAQHKKIKTLITPDLIISLVDNSHHWTNVCMNNIITNYKILKYNEFTKQKKYLSDYRKSDLYELNEIEKNLISSGFKINGPKIIKRISGHDIANGEENLLSSINIYLNNILNLNDPNRDVNPFFEPFPISDESKNREMFEVMLKRVNIYFILYGFDRYREKRSHTIQCLRRRYLCLDLSEPCMKNIIQPYLLKRFNSLRLRMYWQLKVSVQDIKSWWKIVGYSLLIKE